jgi:hypothetical protein
MLGRLSSAVLMVSSMISAIFLACRARAFTTRTSHASRWCIELSSKESSRRRNICQSRCGRPDLLKAYSERTASKIDSFRVRS